MKIKLLTLLLIIAGSTVGLLHGVVETRTEKQQIVKDKEAALKMAGEYLEDGYSYVTIWRNTWSEEIKIGLYKVNAVRITKE